MNAVINRLSYSSFHGKRVIKMPDEWNNIRQSHVRGEEKAEDGIVVYATANHMVKVTNWNVGAVEPIPASMGRVYMSCFDFAPFLYQPKMPALLAQ